VDGLFSSIDNGLSRTCRARDSRGVDDRFLVVAPRARYGIPGTILVAEERQIPGW